MSERWDDAADVADLIDRAILDEPAFLLTEGGIIKDGWNAELDELRAVSRSGKTFIAQLENRERERTGIGSLKVRYNKVFGYYIEVTKPNLPQVPRRLHPQADAGRLGALPDAGAQGVRGKGPPRRGADRRARAPALPRGPRGRGPGDPAPPADRRRRRRARRPRWPWPSAPPAAITSGRRSTTGTRSASRPAATPSSRRARPSRSSPTTSSSTPRRTRS